MKDEVEEKELKYGTEKKRHRKKGENHEGEILIRKTQGRREIQELDELSFIITA